MNCYKKILTSYDSLPKQQKKIADYIVSNINEIVFFSITKLASELEVSEATIVRFSQNLGYKGFPELKKELVHYYQNYLTPGERLKNSIQILAGGEFSFEKVMRHELKMIEDTIDSVNHDQFWDLADSICKAETVFIFGLGRSNEPLVSYLSFRLSRFGKKIREVPYSGINIMEELPFIGKNDLVIIYHFIRVSPDYYCLTNALQAVESKIFLITDNKKLDLVKAVDKVITVNRGPFDNYHTLTVPFAFTSAVILGVAEILGDSAVDFTSKVGTLRRSYYHGMADAYLPYMNENKDNGDDDHS
jgi:DNA-binding MurR/RpiR family transcriptional regulator